MLADSGCGIMGVTVNLKGQAFEYTARKAPPLADRSKRLPMMPRWRNGRRNGLKNRRGQPRASSSLAFGTTPTTRQIEAERA